MNKIGLIIGREFFTRIKKRSFWLMTLIGPLVMACVMLVPLWIEMRDSRSVQKILVVDDTYLFKDSLPGTTNVQLTFSSINLDQAQDLFFKSEFNGILYIPANIMSGGMSAKLFYKEQLGLSTQEYLKSVIEKMIYNFKLQKNNVDLKTIERAHTSIHLITEQISENGVVHETNTHIQILMGYLMGVLMYICIFIYGVQVMRGVIEEKTNRIVEVMISSVKPIQLMMGKIIGIGLVGLMQFALWLVLTIGLYSTAQITVFAGARQEMLQKQIQKASVYQHGANLQVISQDKPLQYDSKVYETLAAFDDFDVSKVVFLFLFYFIGGYLLYAALFAAIGAAVDAETDTQQFMLPITVPLVLSLSLAYQILLQPNSTLAIWFSAIPFTSPIIMLVRLPFGIPVMQLLLSMVLLVAGFLFTTWGASKIYQTGILRYGKKASYKDLLNWLMLRK